jgi:hypothetical protein
VQEYLCSRVTSRQVKDDDPDESLNNCDDSSYINVCVRNLYNDAFSVNKGT